MVLGWAFGIIPALGKLLRLAVLWKTKIESVEVATRLAKRAATLGTSIFPLLPPSLVPPLVPAVMLMPLASSVDAAALTHPSSFIASEDALVLCIDLLDFDGSILERDDRRVLARPEWVC
ncbi:hypothetical protein BC826DRAFT_998758 [Russula brevipes]|nr:hypothetical protein BC826DRAFT_998758 [Russula brevipes]